MKITDRHQLIEQLNWRYATKQFDPARRISAGDWAVIEEALVLTPSSIGLQPWTFLVIDDPETRARLLAATYGQRQVIDASHLVVLATKTNLTASDVEAHVRRVAEVRGIGIESLEGLRRMAVGSVIEGKTDGERLAWATNQTYIALGNLVTSAAILGIDASPMEGFDPGQYDEILGLKQRGLAASVVAALGYRNNSDKYASAPKVRFPLERVVQHI